MRGRSARRGEGGGKRGIKGNLPIKPPDCQWWNTVLFHPARVQVWRKGFPITVVLSKCSTVVGEGDAHAFQVSVDHGWIMSGCEKERGNHRKLKTY
jgi:hypothetical protein